MYKCSKQRMEDKIKIMSRYGDAGHGGVFQYHEVFVPKAIEFFK